MPLPPCIMSQVLGPHHNPVVGGAGLLDDLTDDLSDITDLLCLGERVVQLAVGEDTSEGVADGCEGVAVVVVRI